MFIDVTFGAAIIAGLLSFFSPCILPLVPSYFTFITGLTAEEMIGEPSGAKSRKAVVSTLAFVIGFSLVFILLGATAAFFSNLITAVKPYIRVVGGIAIALLGIHMTGLFHFRALDVEKRLHPAKKPLHFFGGVLIGMAFGAGWSPCIGPLLGSILILAGSQDTVGQGILLLTLYSAGLAVPFLVLSACIHFLFGFVRRASKVLRYVNMVAGAVLIVTGLLLITDKLRLIPFE
jgi:cytochrome c-type biogenesis protein